MSRVDLKKALAVDGPPAQVTTPARTGDVIVYVARIASQGSYGAIRDAQYSRDALKDFDDHEVSAIVVNVETARALALGKLDPLDRLILGL